jgi:uncharacterized protein (DUF1684 family)
MQERLIPLSPFAVKPTKFEREISVTGAPLWQLVYSRTPSEEARPLETRDAEHFTSLLDRPLTNTAKDKLRKDVALFTKQEDSRIASDNKVHALIISTISSDSYTAVKAYPSYPAYLQAKEGYWS